MNQKKLFLRIITGTILATLFIFTFFFLPPSICSLLLTAAIFYLLFFEWLPMSQGMPLIFQLFVPVYILACYRSMVIMNEDATLRPLFLLVFIAACCFDTGAYIAGTLFGKHKIAPNISPKKSWEGMVGGYLFMCAGIFVWAYFFMPDFAVLTIFLGAVLLSATAFFGDLFESWLKRKAGVKDSGTLLPGHGGVFDRLDSILPVAGVIFVGVKNFFNY